MFDYQKAMELNQRNNHIRVEEVAATAEDPAAPKEELFLRVTNTFLDLKAALHVSSC